MNKMSSSNTQLGLALLLPLLFVSCAKKEEKAVEAPAAVQVTAVI